MSCRVAGECAGPKNASVRSFWMNALRLVGCLIVLIAAEAAWTSAAVAQDRPASGAQATPASAADSTAQAWKYVGWFVHSSGVIGLFILVLALYMIFTVVRLN